MQLNRSTVLRTKTTTERQSFLIELSERLWPIANVRFSALSPIEQVFILVWEVEAEVNNGGFNQHARYRSVELQMNNAGAVLKGVLWNGLGSVSGRRGVGPQRSRDWTRRPSTPTVRAR